MGPDDSLQIETPEQIALELPLAGIGSRFLAVALDSVLQGVLYFVAFLLMSAMATLSTYRFLAWIPENWAAALVILFFFCIYWGYFAIFEIFMHGQTPGKRLAGIRVIKDTGRPANAVEVIGRNLMRVVDWLPGAYATGLVCMMVSPQHRRVGDYVAGTVVVHVHAVSEVKPDWNLAPEDGPPNPLAAHISGDELVLIESFLHRRNDLDAAVRTRTAEQIIELVRRRTGLHPEAGQWHEDFLEKVARQVREGARFR
jgi:uncharacterized RDD family membrane protein YckC